MPIIMKKERLFFQIYQSLENELLEMTDYIHFSDKNLDVYSVKLANFILRANVECESLLKELFKTTDYYESLSEKDKKKKLDNSTFVQVNKEYNLLEKKVFIASERFFFEEKYSEPFTPFKYNKNNRDLHKIYNSIKHDRVNNLHKADLETAINVLAVMFILNLYFYPELVYRDQDDRSKIFRGKIAFLEPVFWSTFDEITALDKKEVEEYLSACTYIEWLDDDYYYSTNKYQLTDEKYKINEMLRNRLKEINIPLNEFLQKRQVREDRSNRFFDFQYPTLFLTKKPTINLGFTLESVKDELEKVFNFKNEKIDNHVEPTQ